VKYLDTTLSGAFMGLAFGLIIAGIEDLKLFNPKNFIIIVAFCGILGTIILDFAEFLSH